MDWSKETQQVRLCSTFTFSSFCKNILVFSYSFGDRESCVMDWSKKSQQVRLCSTFTFSSFCKNILVFSSSFGDRKSCVMDWSKKPQHVPPFAIHHSYLPGPSQPFPLISLSSQRVKISSVNFNPVFCLLLHYA